MVFDEPCFRDQLKSNRISAFPLTRSFPRISSSQWVEETPKNILGKEDIDVVSTGGSAQMMELLVHKGLDELFEEHRRPGRCARKPAP